MKSRIRTLLLLVVVLAATVGYTEKNGKEHPGMMCEETLPYESADPDTTCGNGPPL